MLDSSLPRSGRETICMYITAVSFAIAIRSILINDHTVCVEPIDAPVDAWRQIATLSTQWVNTFRRRLPSDELKALDGYSTIQDIRNHQAQAWERLARLAEEERDIYHGVFNLYSPRDDPVIHDLFLRLHRMESAGVD